ncbi:MAG TPA: Rab family GTPase [Gemmatimonadaceae bacterium]|jgi:small GTP-binding protein|nr:Rab family GTPase [Gemmatimonadaceae bacterium]
MLQKKICMVGMFGTGKTCLVQRYVHSLFSVKYLTTVGVKIDRREVQSGGQPVMLMLWDLEGRDEVRNINPSYLKGAHGVLYVVDGTRRDTFEKLFEIRDLVKHTIGDVPSVVALNKSDLTDQWTLAAADERRLGSEGLSALQTSAKSGTGVEAAFQRLADATVAPTGAPR